MPQPRSVRALLSLLLGLAIAVGASCARPRFPDVRGPDGVARPGALWIWAGAVTPRSAVVRAKLPATLDGPRLLVSRNEDFSDAAAVPPDGPIPPHGVATFRVAGLEPATRYYYAIDSSTGRDPLRGRFTTFAEGPQSFAFAFGSCAGTGSTNPIFDTMRLRGPLFLLHLGDFHYRNIARNRPEAFYDAYDRVLASPVQGALYRSAPIVYMWDDHDYGPNDSDRTSPSKPAAQRAYRDVVPHYPLELGDAPLGRISQAFTVGRVRVIVTDTRSERSPAGEPDGEAKTLLGSDQREWLERELADAALQYPVVVWANTVPWITRADARRGHGWEPYSFERTRIADTIKRLGLTSRLIMLSGDAHMAAIDDGTNSNYASDARPGERGFVVAHAAAFDRWPRRKGGPYSHGSSTRRNQFGWVEVQDAGGVIGLTLSAHFRSGDLIPGLRLELRCDDQGCAPVR